MTRGLRRWASVVVGAALALTATSGALAADMTMQPASSAPVAHAGTVASTPSEVMVQVLSWRKWQDDGNLYIVGEIRNTSAYRINAYVTVGIYPGQTGGNETLSDGGIVSDLAPGGRSAFRIVRSPYTQPSAQVTFITAGGEVVPPPAGAIGVTAAGGFGSDPDLEAGPGDFVNVEIRNGTNRPVSIFRAVAAFRSSDGKVSSTGWSDVPTTTLAPGETLTTSVHSHGPSGKLAVRADVDVNASFADGAQEFVVSWQNWFQDIADQSLRMSIAWLAEQGITGGCSTYKYCPTANVTRAQMAIFLVRAFNLPAATGPDHFSDDNGKTGESSINALFESGITGGCKPGLFCPTANVTRAQMAIFLVRALGLPPPAHDHFSDDNGMTGESQINSLYEAGVTGGCAPGKFCPKAPVTRAQMAAFLQRALALP